MTMSAEHRWKLQTFTRNGEVSIWVKHFQVGRQTPNKQTKNLDEYSYMYG